MRHRDGKQDNYAQEQHGRMNSSKNLSRLPSCDQCRRRKVKCGGGAPCERCFKSLLNCTRDIVRRRRGPKKLSAPIPSNLGDEDQETGSQAVAGSPGHLTTDARHSTLHLSVSGVNLVSSTISQVSSDGYGPTSDPSSAPNSNRLLGMSLSALGSHPRQESPPRLPLFKTLSDEALRASVISPGPSHRFLSIHGITHESLSQSSASTPRTCGSSPNDAAIREPNESNRPHLTPRTVARDSPAIESLSTSSVDHLTADRGADYFSPSIGSSIYIEPCVAQVAAEVSVSTFLISQCVKQYFRQLYPVMPIFHESTFRERLMRTEEFAIGDKCLLLALCAVTLLRAAPPFEMTFGTKKSLARRFIAHCQALRKGFEWIEKATLTTAITSFFISISCFDLKQLQSYHLYLREAIAIAEEQGVHQGTPHTGTSHMETICYHRTLALLYATERSCAIQRHKPVSFIDRPVLPTEFLYGEDRRILSGLQCIYNLFVMIDEDFIALWHAPTSEADISAENLKKIKSSQRVVDSMSFEDVQMTDGQMSDILITYQWLRLIFWQASMKLGLVSSSTQDLIFSYEYPIAIAKALCGDLSTLPLDSTLLHGRGVVSTSSAS
jgi:hypothetical protein